MTFNFNKLKDNVLPVFQDVSHHGSILSFLRIPKERSCNCNSKEIFKSSLTWDNSHPDKYTQVPTLVCPVLCTHVKSKANKRICKADNHCEVNQATPAWAITSNSTYTARPVWDWSICAVYTRLQQRLVVTQWSQARVTNSCHRQLQ